MECFCLMSQMLQKKTKISIVGISKGILSKDLSLTYIFNVLCDSILQEPAIKNLVGYFRYMKCECEQSEAKFTSFGRIDFGCFR